MIAKKIKRSHRKQSKLVNVRNLIEYINAPYNKNAEEKLLFSGIRGFVFDDLEIQKKEMLALVHCNVSSPNPVMHYLLSWKEGVSLATCLNNIYGVININGNIDTRSLLHGMVVSQNYDINTRCVCPVLLVNCMVYFLN